MKKTIVIIGGAAGGATAAARLRRLNEQAEIIILEKGEAISWAACGLPYYVGGVIAERQRLLVQSAPGFARRYRVEVRLGSEALQIDRAGKIVTVRGPQGEYQQKYDLLLLSPGAEALFPPIPGLSEAKRVYTLRSLPDADTLKALVEGGAKSCLVAGGGFVGVELAENLAHAGLQVTLVEKEPQVLTFLDAEMAKPLHAELKRNGVTLRLGKGITSFLTGGLVLEDGTRLEADFTCLALGVKPAMNLAKSAGLQTSRGYIVTDGLYRALDTEGKPVESIYAVGDTIVTTDFLGRQAPCALAGPANRQGRLVADAMLGLPVSYSKPQYTSVCKVFGLTAAATGYSEARLQKENIPFQAVHAQFPHHATYYPGAQGMLLKLLFSPDNGLLLGAQAVGAEGADKRIDVLATALRLKATVQDLCDLPLCYAPPYSSAKDPVNQLGYIASNVLDNTYKPAHWYQIDAFRQQGAFLLDVRTPSEFAAGALTGAVNVELDSLREHLSLLPADKTAPLLVNCQGGLRSYLAIRILRANGYTNLYNLSGGYGLYKAQQ